MEELAANEDKGGDEEDEDEEDDNGDVLRGLETSFAAWCGVDRSRVFG